MQELRVNVTKETAGKRRLLLTGGKIKTSGGVGKEAVLPRPSDGDVKQSPFFFKGLRTVGRKGVREKPFFETGDKNVFKFKAFGGVDGHESDTGSSVVVRAGVLVGEEGNVFKVTGEGYGGVGVFFPSRLNKFRDGT